MQPSDKSSGAPSGRTRYGHHDRGATYGTPRFTDAEAPETTPSASITDEEFAAANASCVAEQSAP